MKKLVPIGLLVLLLCNTFGPSFAVFFFENNYQSASANSGESDLKIMKMYLPSLPYSNDIQVTENMEGLIRQEDNFYNPTEVYHENDTLYVTLKANQAARDRFFELANAMQNESSAETDVPEHPFGKVLKQLTNLVKDYFPEQVAYCFASKSEVSRKNVETTFPLDVKYLSFKALLLTPPPEFS